MDFDTDELKRVFVAEAEECLSAMEQGLLALETRPDDGEALATVFRQTHTLKGSAGTLGLEGVTALAHSAEELLDRRQQAWHGVTPDVASLLLEAVDALRRMVSLVLEEANPAPPADLMKALNAMATRREEKRNGPVFLDAQGASRGLSAETAGRGSGTLRVDLSRLDRMLNLAGEIAVVQGRLGRLVETGTGASAGIRETFEASNGLIGELQEEITRVRMVPIGPLFRRFTRTVRDVAGASGKEAHLVLSGEDVEVDTSVVERLAEPLTHMVRNAVDHGVETPDLRRASGKEARGTITLSARHETGCLVVEVKDDGRGLDRRLILERAAARGLVREGDTPGEEAIRQLIFEAGLSTASVVTELSGRGIGMDVVRRQVAALRGSVRVDSEPTKGTCLTLRLPLTLAIVPGFAVEAAGEVYVVPLEAVVECFDLPSAEAIDAGHSGVLRVRGQAIPYLRLTHHFGAREKVLPGRESVVLVQDARHRAGLAVNRLLGEVQTVVKPLGGLALGKAGVSGATIMGDGRVALILDVSALLTEAEMQSQAKAQA